MKQTTIAVIVIAAMGSSAFAEPVEKTGKTASGGPCNVKVERHADGSITALGSSSSGTTGSTASSGALSSSSSAGSSSVHVQAGGGNVSSSSSTAGGPGSTAASTVTVNGCTISTTSP